MECVAVPVRLAIRQLSILDGAVHLVHLKAVGCFRDLLPGTIVPYIAFLSFTVISSALVLMTTTQDLVLLAFACRIRLGLLMTITIPTKMAHLSTGQSTKQAARVYRHSAASTINPFLALSAKQEEAQPL